MQTVQINGGVWQQSQFVCVPGDNGQAGGKTEQIGVLVSTTLYNNKYYGLDYMAEPATFNNAYQTFFIFGVRITPDPKAATRKKAAAQPRDVSSRRIPIRCM
jgi:hypothetical protein